MTMPIGKMDTLILLESATESKSAVTGQVVLTWMITETLWAEVIEKSSGESEKLSQITSTDEKIFRVRYVSGVTAKMRVHVPELNRYYDITGITHEGRKHFLLIHARTHNVSAPA